MSEGKVYFVSRHPGAVEWAARQGIAVDEVVAHLDLSVLKEGDVVIGNLPVHLVAEVCQKGARYCHLSMEVPAEARGKELSAEEMEKYGARLEEFVVKREEEDGRASSERRLQADSRNG